MSLGLHISVDKLEETELDATYAFYVRPGSGGAVLADPTGAKGRLRIEKATSRVELVASCADDAEDAKLFPRAAMALVREWRQGRLPVLTSWAA